VTNTSDGPRVIRTKSISEVARGAGVGTRPLVGRWNTGGGLLTTGITRFAPGTSIPEHHHNVEETVIVLDGDATVVILDQRYDLVAGDVTWVPGGTPHYFKNRGQKPMSIYWVYAGRDVSRTLTESGETFEHLSQRDLTIGRET
jgi:HTH-type transcriptional regulator, repressor for puuD